MEKECRIEELPKSDIQEDILLKIFTAFENGINLTL